MNKPLPNIGQAPVRITLKDTTAIQCKCGCETFLDATLLRKVSPLLTGTGKEGVQPIPTFVCSACGLVCEELLPNELKPQLLKG